MVSEVEVIANIRETWEKWIEKIPTSFEPNHLYLGFYEDDKTKKIIASGSPGGHDNNRKFVLHNVDGPSAILYRGEVASWHQFGKLHNESGPASVDLEILDQQVEGSYQIDSSVIVRIKFEYYFVNNCKIDKSLFDLIQSCNIERLGEFLVSSNQEVRALAKHRISLLEEI